MDAANGKARWERVPARLRVSWHTRAVSDDSPAMIFALPLQRDWPTLGQSTPNHVPPRGLMHVARTYNQSTRTTARANLRVVVRIVRPVGAILTR